MPHDHKYSSYACRHVAMLLLAMLPTARTVVVAQSSPIAAHRQSSAVVPASQGITDATLSMLDSALYLYKGHLLLRSDIRKDGLAPLVPDTTLANLYPSITSIVRQPVTGTLFFTVPDRSGHSTLRYAYQSGSKTKTKQVKLDGFDVYHPTFSSDGRTFVFASRHRQAGYGGFDLWYSRYEDGQWSAPQNIGNRINGGADEVSPVIVGDYLIFASNSRPQSRGKLALFATRLIADSVQSDTAFAFPIGRSTVQALPEPFINSQHDVQNLVSFGIDSGGYFLCGNDIVRYQSTLYATHVWGYITDVEGRPIADAVVSVQADHRTLCTAKPDPTGLYHLVLPVGTAYTLACKAPGRFASRTTITPTHPHTGDLIRSTRHDIHLDALPIGKPAYYADLFGPNTSSELCEQGRQTLDLIARFLTDNPSLSATISLVSDPTTDADFNAILTAHRLEVIEEYLLTRIPSAVSLITRNACEGNETCSQGTGLCRLSVLLR